MIEIQDHLEADRIPQLMDLYSSAWWAEKRKSDDVAAMLAGSDVIIALVDDDAEGLVGFTRVLTDFAYLAMVLDVVVHPRYRNAGLGRMLLEAVVDHPRLSNVESIELVCQPELVPFYSRWGFTDQVGRSLLMRRARDHGLSIDIRQSF